MRIKEVIEQSISLKTHLLKDEIFLKENIQKMCELKQSSLVKECVSLGIPREFANTILEDTKIVDESFTKGLKS